MIASESEVKHPNYQENSTARLTWRKGRDQRGLLLTLPVREHRPNFYDMLIKTNDGWQVFFSYVERLRQLRETRVMRGTATFLMVGWALLQSSTPGHAQETQLFNGRDLSGWEFFLVEEGARMEDVWSVRDGILIATGEPQGYLYTTEEYESYKLVVEWRWPGEPGNSGVLLRVTPEAAMLPSAVEAQLRSGRAGDMYGFQGFRIGGNPHRLSEISIGWGLPRIQGNEKEPGEWNLYEITVDGDQITLVINGVVVNEAWNCEVRPGRIALQSEGAEIHFRTVALTPLEE
jgi:hypothetical protein